MRALRFDSADFVTLTEHLTPGEVVHRTGSK